MDPITSFQVAASALAFVEFAAQLLSGAHAVYKSPEGQACQSVELSVIASDLKQASRQIQDKLVPLQGGPSSSADQELHRICRECMDVSREVEGIVSKLRAQGTSKIDYARSCVVVAAKGIFHGNRLARLEKKLQQLRASICMWTLTSLWATSKDWVSKLDKTDKRIESLVDTMEHLKNPRRSASDYETLAQNLWDAKWCPTGVPASLTESPEGKDIAKHLRSRIISSLWFDDFRSREESIQEAHAETFKWIFSPSDKEKDTSVAWPLVTAWLKSQSKSIYWITGKPGSGKSTLMKYITIHPSTAVCLKEWAGGLGYLLSCYFSWHTGSGLQKSKEGLLRTLLYECLESWPEAIESVCARRWFFACEFPSAVHQLPEWKLAELQESFRTLLSLSGRLFRLAIFIDGLDEFHADHRDLVRWIIDWSGKYDVKVCVASRYWPEFSDALSQGPHIRMEDLTKRDITAFVTSSFSECGGFRILQLIFPSECESLMQSIVEKAKGVFLWVHLVVKNLVHHIEKRKSGNIKELQTMLDDLPTEMDALYNHIWDRIEPADKATASRLIQTLAASFDDLHALAVWVVEGNDIPRQVDGTIMQDKVEHIIHYVRGMLDAHTRGILEMSPSGLISVLHRSGAEWLNKESVWNEICSKAPPTFDPQLALLQVGASRLGDVIRARVGHGHSLRSDFWWAVTLYLYHAPFVKSSPEHDKALVKAMDQIDMLVTKVANEIGLIRETCEDIYKDVVLVGGCNYSPYHWVVTQGNCGLTVTPGSVKGFIYENSTVGLAAQLGMLPYIKDKLSRNPDLLRPDRGRISLLENAALGFEYHSLRKAVNRYVINQLFFPEQRIETVKYLLTQGANPGAKIADPSECESGEVTIKSEVLRLTQPSRKSFEEEAICFRKIAELFEPKRRLVSFLIARVSRQRKSSSEVPESEYGEISRMAMKVGLHREEDDED